MDTDNDFRNYLIFGCIIMLLFAAVMVCASINNKSLKLQMASKGYVECPLEGKTGTYWVPSSECPALQIHKAK